MPDRFLACWDWYDWEEDEWFTLWAAQNGERVAVWLTDEEDEVLLVVRGETGKKAASASAP